jgi:hypothetical protein
LQRENRLAGAWSADQQRRTAAWQTSVRNGIETDDAGSCLGSNFDLVRTPDGFHEISLVVGGWAWL